MKNWRLMWVMLGVQILLGLMGCVFHSAGMQVVGNYFMIAMSMAMIAVWTIPYKYKLEDIFKK